VGFEFPSRNLCFALGYSHDVPGSGLPVLLEMILERSHVVRLEHQVRSYRIIAHSLCRLLIRVEKGGGKQKGMSSLKKDLFFGSERFGAVEAKR